MRRPSPLPHGLQHGPFSTNDARDAGVGRQRTRSDTLQSPYFAVRTHRRPESTQERAEAYAMWMQPTQFFSHLTAAELLALRMPEGFRPVPLHVSSAPPARAPRSRGVVGHQCSLTTEPLRVGRLLVAGPIDTWLSLGSVLSVDDLVVMGDGLVSRFGAVADMGTLTTAVHSFAGRRGFARLATAMPQVRPNTDSARETMLRLLAVRAGFPEPEINGVILNSFGATIAHGDLVFRAHRTILEYDGGGHRTNERQFQIDIARLDELMEEGWRVIRVDKGVMSRRATLIGKIETALTKGAWSRG